jgi:hypothetical protein
VDLFSLGSCLVRRHSLHFPFPVARIQLRSSGIAGFTAQLRFERCQLGGNVLLSFALANDLLAITPEEIVDGFDSDLDRARRLIFVEIFEAEVRGA